MERYIKQAFLTFLLLFAVSTAVWAGNGPPPGACCIPSGEPTECDIGSEAFCNNAGGAYQGDGTTCDNNPCDLPPTRDINVRVIAICAAPVGVEPHDGGDGISCLCFGRFFNGFNATGTQPNGRCARSQVGPFCFVDTIVGPLFWKETVEDESGPTTVDPGNIVEATVRCPDGKMVLSCQGEVLVGDTTEPAANVASYKFPTDDGLACKHVARTDLPPPCGVLDDVCCPGDVCNGNLCCNFDGFCTDDADPPVISNFQLTGFTSQTVSASWNTDIPAACQVEAIKRVGGTSIFTPFGEPATNHQDTVTGLESNTLYDVRAICNANCIQTLSDTRAVRTGR